MGPWFQVIPPLACHSCQPSNDRCPIKPQNLPEIIVRLNQKNEKYLFLGLIYFNNHSKSWLWGCETEPIGLQKGSSWPCLSYSTAPVGVMHVEPQLFTVLLWSWVIVHLDTTQGLLYLGTIFTKGWGYGFSRLWKFFGFFTAISFGKWKCSLAWARLLAVLFRTTSFHFTSASSHPLKTQRVVFVSIMSQKTNNKMVGHPADVLFHFVSGQGVHVPFSVSMFIFRGKHGVLQKQFVQCSL